MVESSNQPDSLDANIAFQVLLLSFKLLIVRCLKFKTKCLQQSQPKPTSQIASTPPICRVSPQLTSGKKILNLKWTMDTPIYRDNGDYRDYCNYRDYHEYCDYRDAFT